MSFTSYALVADISAYVPDALADLWSDDEDDALDALQRAARAINDRFRGMDKFDTVPIEEEDDGYAEILIELNVY